MAATTSLHLFYASKPFGQCKQTESCLRVNTNFSKFRSLENRLTFSTYHLSSAKRLQAGTSKFSKRLNVPIHSSRTAVAVIACASSFAAGHPKAAAFSLKPIILALKRVSKVLEGKPVVVQCAPSAIIVAFAVWGLGPLLQFFRHFIFRRNANNWKKSRTNFIMVSYIRPILLWSGALLLCRTLDPIVLSSDASQVVKQRLVTFVRSLSTVLACAYCTSSLIKQIQKFAMEQNELEDTRTMGFNFMSKALYTAVWVAAVSLFMELLGFSTQKWLTAGGFGTLLLTLAGREIFTNFLSSVMIHATRPFVVNEWIQTKIEGCEVSGTVEHVGWWSPTIIRGEDREAVHIPNHKFTMSVVRNLSQKTHWRIKAHMAVSHQDIHKISNIVADMRKVIAKNPNVEQQRLHRRVFLDSLDPENQSLRIMVSCFVKTSHFEEYLCVKEAIYLDLLRVISHHRARLATPIRTIQKAQGDVDSQNIPFEGSISGRVINRPLLLVETSKSNSEDKGKQRSRGKEEPVSKTATETKATEGSVNSKIEASKRDNDVNGNIKSKEAVKELNPADLLTKDEVQSSKGTKDEVLSSKGTVEGFDSAVTKKQLEGLDSMGLNSKDRTLLKAAYEKPPVDIPEAHVDSPVSKTENTSDKNSKAEKTAKQNGTKYPAEVSTDETADSVKSGPLSQLGTESKSDISKQKTKESSTGTPSKVEGNQSASAPSKPAIEKNIVLGVALDGPKRTLPIEEGNIAAEGEQSELSKSQNVGANSGSKNKDIQLPSVDNMHSEQRSP